MTFRRLAEGELPSGRSRQFRASVKSWVNAVIRADLHVDGHEKVASKRGRACGRVTAGLTPGPAAESPYLILASSTHWAADPMLFCACLGITKNSDAVVVRHRYEFVALQLALAGLRSVGLSRSPIGPEDGPTHSSSPGFSSQKR